MKEKSISLTASLTYIFNYNYNLYLTYNSFADNHRKLDVAAVDMGTHRNDLDTHSHLFHLALEVCHGMEKNKNLHVAGFLDNMHFQQDLNHFLDPCLN